MLLFILSLFSVSPSFAGKYEEGIQALDARDFKQALVLLRDSALEGDVRAQVTLGKMYQSGEGIPQDLEKAREFYELSTKQGNPDAQCNLGAMYFEGEGVPKDLSKAREFFELSARQGNPEAQSYLGYMYFKGKGVLKDLGKARDYLELSAKQGNHGAQAIVGYIYFEGEGGPKDLGKAREYFELSAKQGNPHAQYYMGHMYFYGQGVPKNPALAAKFFKSALKTEVLYDQKMRLNELISMKAKDRTVGKIKAWSTAIYAKDAKYSAKLCAQSVKDAQIELNEQREKLKKEFSELKEKQNNIQDPAQREEFLKRLEKIKSEYERIPERPNCAICFECYDTLVSPQCILKRSKELKEDQKAHLFCDRCLSLALAQKDACPVCRTPDCMDNLTGIDLTGVLPLVPLEDVDSSKVSDLKE